MIRVALGLSFVVSIIALPSWTAIFIAALFLGGGGAPLLVIVGGVLLDLLLGAPIAALHGFSYLYTTLMLLLSGAAWYLRKSLLE